VRVFIVAVLVPLRSLLALLVQSFGGTSRLQGDDL
jgi:hypothetical protein